MGQQKAKRVLVDFELRRARITTAQTRRQGEQHRVRGMEDSGIFFPHDGQQV
jgi:hypothetical protein